MITEKEKQLIDEIIDEGHRKYWEKLKVLADVIGADTSLALDQTTGIWRWLKDNKAKYAEVYGRHGLSIRETDDDGDTFVMRGNDGDGGEEFTELRVHTYTSVCGSTTQYVTHYMSPASYRDRYKNLTATDAIDGVARAIKEVTLWTLLAIRYNAIRKDVDGIETDESDARVEKAMHQLELLRKL